MFKRTLLLIFPIIICIFFSTPSLVIAQTCSGSHSVTLNNSTCNGIGTCNSSSITKSFSCAQQAGGCNYYVSFSGVQCKSTPGTNLCTCSQGATSCSSEGAKCGSGTQTCSCSDGSGSCSGNGSSCGVYGGSCSCSAAVYGSCGCTATAQTCTQSASSASGYGSCPTTCTWGAWSACSVSCGGGTQSQTSSCGVTQSRACNIGACCGNGSCSGGETCSSCSSDCGACPVASPPPQFCGDNSCNNGESCSSCAKDCGTCPPSCSPSCSNACGQSNGCSGTCSNSDNGTPGVPTNLTPPNGTAITPTGSTADLGWDAVSKADLYEVQVYPTGTAAGQECTVVNHHCPALSSSNSYSFTLDSGVNSYSWRVRAINNTCGSSQVSAWTTPVTFTLSGTFTGNFYTDNSNTAVYNGFGLCQSGTAIQADPPVGTTIQAIEGGNNYSGTITSSSYTVTNVRYNPSTTLSITPPAGYRCTCPAGCTYSGISVPNGNVHFFISNTPVGWWQTANAYLYAGVTSGPAIQSKIPVTCASSGTCTAALSKYDSSSTLNSDSTSLSGGGTIDSTDDTSNTYSYLNESGTNSHAEGMALNGPREDYNYFAQLYGITNTTTPDFTGDQPTAAPANGNAYYANGDVNINNQWTLNTADSIVVFVNGNLNVNSPILVAKGGFVSFIVKGNITFAKGLGSNSSNAPTVAGVFVANGQIITESNSPGDDLKFIGEGTFVGWGGVQLQRSFNNTYAARGATEPIESFNFRPDFLLTVPEKMTKPLYLWQETN